MYTVSDRLPYEIALTFIGVFQLVTLWLARKELPESIAAMAFLSSLSILALLLSIPVLGQGNLFLVTVMYLMIALNIIDLSLLSQESTTSRMLHRQVLYYNDGPVLLLVTSHVSYGFILFSLSEFWLPIMAYSLTTTAMILLYSIWIAGALLVLAIPFLILRQKYAGILFLVLDIAVLIMCLVSGILAIQQPDALVSPWELYRVYKLTQIGQIALMGILFGVLPCAVLVGSIPALDTDEKAIAARRENLGKPDLPEHKQENE